MCGVHARDHRQQFPHAPRLGQSQMHEVLRNIEILCFLPEIHAGAGDQAAVERRHSLTGAAQALRELIGEILRRTLGRCKQAERAYVQWLLALLQHEKSTVNEGKRLHRFLLRNEDRRSTEAAPPLP